MAIATTEDPMRGAAAITPHDVNVVPAGRALAVICTVAGNVKVQFKNGSTFTFPVAVGMTCFPWRVVQVFVTGTTATATYANLA